MPASAPQLSSLAPKRSSLVEQVADLLREAIAQGRWAGSFPSERELSAEAKVSRPTLRIALAVLEKEGLLARHGRRSRSVGKPAARRAQAGTVVRLLSPIAAAGMQEHDLLWLDELRGLLAEKHYELQLHVQPRLYTAPDELGFRKIHGDGATAGWISYRTSLALQKWLARHAPRTVLVGTTYEEVRLSSVDIDHRAVCRHAATALARAGHAQFFYVGLSAPRAGDLESEAGFLEGLPAAVRVESRSRFLRHDGTVPGICRVLDQALRRKAPPTGFVVANSNHALTVVGHLAERGWIAGRHYALIARDGAPFFGHMTPSVAHYVTLPTRIARELATLVLKQANRFSGAVTRKVLMPVFQPGASLVGVDDLRRS